jgi:hypothetical protein
MSTIDGWMEISGNQLDKSKVCIEEKLVGLLQEDEYKQWLLMEEHVSDYYNWYPIQHGSNGIRFHAIYININKESAKHGQLYRLTSHCPSGEVEFHPETFYFQEYHHICK